MSINSSKGVMKIFIDINDKKVQSNSSEPNFYLLLFKNIEVKDEFHKNFNHLKIKKKKYLNQNL